MPRAGSEGEYTYDAGEGGEGLFQSVEEHFEPSRGELAKKNLDFGTVMNYTINVFQSHHTSI